MNTKIMLAKRLASANNYAYEATMNDYSMASINRATGALGAARSEVALAGYTEDELVMRNDYGVWVPIQGLSCD